MVHRGVLMEATSVSVRTVVPTVNAHFSRPFLELPVVFSVQSLETDELLTRNNMGTSYCSYSSGGAVMCRREVVEGV